MEDQVKIACPLCGFSKTMAQGAIPAGMTRATCPKCRQAFTLSAETMIPQPHPAAAPLPPADPPSIQATSRPLPPSTPRTLRFAFHGTARDYFRIWLVNTLLKLVTIGGYTAWAKVRKRRFFYGNTKLHGESFEYIADPQALFKGWLIGATAFILYMIASRVSPLLGAAIAILIFLIIPWLVVRSRVFNARNSSHRTIRFDFRPDYRQAYLVFAGLPLLVPFTLGLLAPYMLYRQCKFLVENSSYGSTTCDFSATPGDFYRLFAKATLGLGVIVALGAGLAFLLKEKGLAEAAWIPAAAQGGPKWPALLPICILPLVYFYLVTYVRTTLANLTWNSTVVIGNCFRSTLCTRDMVWLYLTNILAIACSFGLLVPWAAVRMTRYRFDRLEMTARNGLDDFLATVQGAEAGADGGEMGNY